MLLPPPIPPQGPRTPGWWRRHWRWAMPTAVLLLATVAVATSAWTLLRWRQAAQASAPLQEALRRAACSIDLVTDFGEPLKPGWLPLGNMQTTLSGQRTVALMVSLEGPDNRGQLFVQGVQQDGQWDYPVVYVLGPKQQTYDLSALDDAEAALECELRECREQGDCPLTASL